MIRSVCALLLLPGALHAQTYFQQHVAYTIQVELDDSTHVLRGQEEFIYTNNSAVALDTIHLHLWPNAYRDHRSALCKQLDAQNQLDLHFAKQEDRGEIDGLAFSDLQGPLTWGYHPVHPDIGWLLLREPLGPGQQVTIRTPFRVKIPDGRFSRLGHTDQAYYITQWYPKPAVFDAQGWHAMPYLTLGEFYSEFGSFDVSITLPANYVVGATGELQNAEERAWMDSLAARPLSISISKGRDPFPVSDTTTKTIRFLQDSVHDFAWFADKRFQVRKSSVTLPRSGRTVTTWALFTPKNAALWDKGAEYVSESVRLYSQWVGDYPYSACTAVDGTISAGGGMEYPMITIIGNMNNAQALDEVIAHEVGHNWFYGMLGSNERDHAWMDEGVNSFVELRYMRERYPGKGGNILPDAFSKFLPERNLDHRLLTELTYRLNARRGLDQAIAQTSAGFTVLNYGAMVYSKSTLVFDHLFAFLGQEVFDRCMQAYFREWHHKHPMPRDMRAVFERESGKELGWVFDELIATDHKIDVRAVKLKDGLLTHRTRADHAIPFPVTGWDGKDSLGTVWIDGAAGKGSTVVPWSSADRGRIDAPALTLDIDRRNNTVRSNGLFKHWASPQLKPLVGVERHDRRTAYWSPALAYNAHDGFMAGLAFHNFGFPTRRFEWAVAPLYGFRSERPVGGARFMFHHDRMRGGFLENIHVGVAVNSASLFSQEPFERYYLRVVPQVKLDIRNDRAKRNTAHFISFRSNVLQEYLQGTQGDSLRIDLRKENIYHELSYSLDHRSGLMPSSLKLDVQHHNAFTRLAVEARQAFVYDRKGHRVSVRLFAGQFLRKDAALMQNQMGWRLHWGSSDMTFDHLFMNRQDVGTTSTTSNIEEQSTSTAYVERGIDRVLAQQFAKDQGAFKTPTSYGASSSWLAATNLEFDLPIGLPLVLFASAAAAPTRLVTQTEIKESWDMYYEAGFGIRLVRDIAEVWVPLAFSKDIGDQLLYNKIEFTERIRFVFALEKLDPTTLLRRIRN